MFKVCVSGIGISWVALKYHNAASEMTKRYMEKMIAQESSQIDFSMSSYDYLSSLCPGTSSVGFSSKGPSIRKVFDDFTTEGTA
ncbi:hypothetical protein OROGR_008023 [Orobanche gracilis]